MRDSERRGDKSADEERLVDCVECRKRPTDGLILSCAHFVCRSCAKTSGRTRRGCADVAGTSIVCAECSYVTDDAEFVASQQRAAVQRILSVIAGDCAKCGTDGAIMLHLVCVAFVLAKQTTASTSRHRCTA
jgi:hypothetical protein